MVVASRTIRAEERSGDLRAEGADQWPQGWAIGGERLSAGEKAADRASGGSVPAR